MLKPKEVDVDPDLVEELPKEEALVSHPRTTA